MLTLGGFVLLLVALCVLLVCCGSPKRRKLAILMWSHPNPAMGPLYMPDEMRWEFALDIGLEAPPSFCRGLALLCCSCSCSCSCCCCFRGACAVGRRAESGVA